MENWAYSGGYFKRICLLACRIDAGKKTINTVHTSQKIPFNHCLVVSTGVLITSGSLQVQTPAGPTFPRL